MVGQILCLGVFANSIGSMYYALLHAKGRADITAKLHIIELPIFLAALFFLLHEYGITGAAWAWVGRMVFDAAALAWCTKVSRS
jgi:O-antigen/teichoic acid export membrane protein